MFSDKSRSSAWPDQVARLGRQERTARYFFSSGCFFATAAGVDAVLKRFASALRGDQSEGGKDTRQNLGLGSANSIPTSCTPLLPGLMSTTLQCSSSAVFRFFTWSRSPNFTTVRNWISAPCAFTIMVDVCSSNATPFIRVPVTEIPTESRTRWLRRCPENCETWICGVFTECGYYPVVIGMHVSSHFCVLK